MNKKTKELNRINNELDKQISAENVEAFTNIICYLRGANVSEYQQESVRQDLLEMVLTAQKRGENIASVIGKNYKVFCDDIISNLPPKSTKENIISTFDLICWCTSILCAINIVISRATIDLIKNIITQKPLILDLSVSIGTILSFVIIIGAAVIIVEYIIKTSLNTKKKKNKPGTIKLFFTVAGFMAVILFITWVGKATLFTVNIFIAIAFTIALYLVHIVLSKMQ